MRCSLLSKLFIKLMCVHDIVCVCVCGSMSSDVCLSVYATPVLLPLMSVCMFVCLSVYTTPVLLPLMSVCMYVCLSVCLHNTCTLMPLPLMSVCMSVCLSVYTTPVLLPLISVCMFVCLSVYTTPVPSWPVINSVVVISGSLSCGLQRQEWALQRMTQVNNIKQTFPYVQDIHCVLVL